MSQCCDRVKRDGVINSESLLAMLCYVFHKIIKITNGIFHCPNLAHNYNKNCNTCFYKKPGSRIVVTDS